MLALAPLAHAFVFLGGYEEAPTVAAALERLKARPEKHVLIYFGMSRFSEADAETRAVLTSDTVRDRWRPNYIVVNIDLYAPSKEEREVIDQVRVSWAPVLLFLDSTGKRVAYARRLYTERDALLLNDFVSRREYATCPRSASTPGRTSTTWARAGWCPRFSSRPAWNASTTGRACATCSRRSTNACSARS